MDTSILLLFTPTMCASLASKSEIFHSSVMSRLLYSTSFWVSFCLLLSPSGPPPRVHRFCQFPSRGLGTSPVCFPQPLFLITGASRYQTVHGRHVSKPLSCAPVRSQGLVPQQSQCPAQARVRCRYLSPRNDSPRNDRGTLAARAALRQVFFENLWNCPYSTDERALSR